MRTDAAPVPAWDPPQDPLCASALAAFDAAEVRRIIATAAQRGWSQAEVSRPHEVDRSYRSAQLRWLHRHDAGWVFERLELLTGQLNRDGFGFHLAGFHDPLQLTRYDVEGGGHYDWHMDRAPPDDGKPARKLTVVVQLTESAAYQGGDLQTLTGREPRSLSRALGAVHVFPSFVLHRVTPVTAGTRTSLVGWLVGDRFR
jgi:PKHD-type hydroxylase